MYHLRQLRRSSIEDNIKLSFFLCAFRGRVRDYIDNPSKPPFKFTSLLFVATARKNKFICSSLALIATLIREACLDKSKPFVLFTNRGYTRRKGIIK